MPLRAFALALPLFFILTLIVKSFLPDTGLRYDESKKPLPFLSQNIQTRYIPDTSTESCANRSNTVTLW